DVATLLSLFLCSDEYTIVYPRKIVKWIGMQTYDNLRGILTTEINDMKRRLKRFEKLEYPFLLYSILTNCSVEEYEEVFNNRKLMNLGIVLSPIVKLITERCL